MSLRGGPGPDGGAVGSESAVTAGGRGVASIAGVESCEARDFCVDEMLALVDAGSDWIWETDAQMRFSWFSSNYEEITGIIAKEVLGRFRFDFLKQVSRGSASVTAHLADLDARRPFRNFVYELKGGKPECRWISVTGNPRFDANGAFLGYRGIARNVTSVAASLEDLEAAHRQLANHEGQAKRRADERAGQSHAERMMAALNVMKDAFSYYDSDDRLVLYNEAMLDLYRGLADEIRPGVAYERLLDLGMQRGLWDIGDADPEAWRRAALARRAEPQWQSEIQAADGRWIMHREMRTADGGMIGISTDISALKQRETELATARDRTSGLLHDLRRMVDVMSTGIIVLDADLRTEIINAAFYDLWSIDSARVAEGATFAELMSASRHIDAHGVSDGEWQAHMAEREAELRSGLAVARELKRSDGRTMISTTAPLSGGKLLVSYVDITEMKQREAALADALERSKVAEAVIDGVRDPVFVKDSDLKWVVVNRAFSEMFGVEPEELIGKSDRDFFPREEAERFAEAERRVLATGEAFEFEENPEFSGATKTRIVRKSRVRTQSGKDYISCFLFDVTEMKRREMEAEQARKQLSDVLERMPAGILIYDAQDRFVYANKELQDSLPGLTPAWRPGSTLREAFEYGHSIGYFRRSGIVEVDALYDTDKERWIDAITKRYHLKHFTCERMNPNGRWYQVHDMRVEDGTFIGVRVDITELKNRERALRDSMNQIDLLRHTLDELPVAAFIKAKDLRIEYVNKVWSEMTGISKEQAIGHTDFELFKVEQADGYSHADSEVIKNGRQLVVEEPVMHRDRSVRQLMTRKSRLVASDGSIHLVGSSTDITEVKDREVQLNESLRENEVFRSLIDNVPVAIYAKRPDLKLFYVNKGWSDLTGIAIDDAIGHTDVEIFGASGGAFMEADRSVLKTMSQLEIAEEVVTDDGNKRYQIARKSVMTARDGTLYLIGSTTDVTDLKEREKQLEEAQRKAVLADRAKSEFLANMSHEIRTPMNGVLGMAELLARSELNSKQKMFTDIIVKSGNALLTIINDILDFSKIDAGQMVLDIAPFNLAEAIEDVATLVSTRAKEKDLEMIVRVEPKCQEMFHGDVGRMRQIITNLLGNAVKFTESGYVLVEVTGEKGDGETRLKISVTDTGIGIPADKLDAVFEKFSQVDSSSTRKHEGTGLGLAITSRLVELMDGKIGVESTEGKGSTFWFTVTLKDAGVPEDRRPMPVDVTGARVLVIDDNAVNRTILGEQMESWTFDACAAASGPEGLKVLEAAASMGVAVDCIVLDYQMPGMTGADVARAIRATPAIRDTPIVMLTSVDQTLINYRDLGIDAQLIKPARSSALLETLVATIQKHRSLMSDLSSEEWLHIVKPRTSPVEPKHAPATELPLAREAMPPAVEALEEQKPVGGHRVDILVAEDNEVNQLVFTQILSETPFTFEIVNNGRLAVEAFKDSNPRMILMDVSMPEMNGLQATGAIRTMEQGASHVPIVGVTAHALKGDRERCMESGMDDYLPKPISPRALMEKIDKWIGAEATRQRSAG